MKHTPEPWYVAHHQFIYAENHLLVGQTACPPALSDDPVATQAINADRIVACVNACAGISEESLADDCWNKMRDDRDRLAALNAELVATVIKVQTEMQGIWSQQAYIAKWEKMLLEAIAKAGETK